MWKSSNTVVDFGELCRKTKNGQILPYSHFNKIMKGPGTSFQSPASSQKHVKNVCHTAH